MIYSSADKSNKYRTKQNTMDNTPAPTAVNHVIEKIERKILIVSIDAVSGVNLLRRISGIVDPYDEKYLISIASGEYILKWQFATGKITTLVIDCPSFEREDDELIRMAELCAQLCFNQTQPGQLVCHCFSPRSDSREETVLTGSLVNRLCKTLFAAHPKKALDIDLVFNEHDWYAVQL